MSDSSVDVLLAHSYFLKYDPKQLQKMRPYAPLATLYAASALRSAGYSVALFDAMLADGEARVRAGARSASAALSWRSTRTASTFSARCA